MNIRPFRETDESDVVELWQLCDLTRPWNNPNRDIERKLTVQREMFLVGEVEEKIVATVMAGYDGHRGWINYLAVHPNFQGKQIGRALVDAVEHKLLEAGCPKINLQVRSTNVKAVEFYKRIGFVQDDVLSFGKRIISDQARD